MMPSTAPNARLSVRTSAARIRFIGHVYLISSAAPSSTVTTPSVTHAVRLLSTTAQTAIAANTSREPGSSGTTMPISPTAIARATRTMPPVLTGRIYFFRALPAYPLDVAEILGAHADEPEVLERCRRVRPR